MVRRFRRRLQLAGGCLAKGDLRLIVGSVLVVLLLLAFSGLADVISEAGDVPWLDRALLSALRVGPDGTDPVGPEWVEDLFLDLTVLGSGTLVIAITVLVLGFLLIERRLRFAAAILVASLGAWGFVSVFKDLFRRPRPTLVEAMLVSEGHSFPSGHALQAAALYSTLGVLLASAVQSHRSKNYILGCAVLLALIVGWTRVHIGVHYPTDVLAGWALGFSWALAVGMALRVLRFTAPGSVNSQ